MLHPSFVSIRMSEPKGVPLGSVGVALFFFLVCKHFEEKKQDLS